MFIAGVNDTSDKLFTSHCYPGYVIAGVKIWKKHSVSKTFSFIAGVVDTGD
jgi:hypothetical protein